MKKMRTKNTGDFAFWQIETFVELFLAGILIAIDCCLPTLEHEECFRGFVSYLAMLQHW
jgi:hypothetical protein